MIKTTIIVHPIQPNSHKTICALSTYTLYKYNLSLFLLFLLLGSIPAAFPLLAGLGSLDDYGGLGDGVALIGADGVGAQIRPEVLYKHTGIYI